MTVATMDLGWAGGERGRREVGWVLCASRTLVSSGSQHKWLHTLGSGFIACVVTGLYDWLRDSRHSQPPESHLAVITEAEGSP